SDGCVPFFFSSRRRHTRFSRDWSSDVCSSDLFLLGVSLVFPIMFIQYVIDVEGILPSSFLQAFFSASLLEEFFKWFILYFTIYRSEERRVGKEYRSRCGLYDVNENSSTE